MAASRTEIRVGTATLAGTGLTVIGGRVPVGKRWNLNIQGTCVAYIQPRYPDYGVGQEATAATGAQAASGAISPNEQWLAWGASTDLLVARILSPGVLSATQTVAAGVGTILDVKFSPDGTWLAVGGTSSPFLKVFAFSNAFGVGLAVSNPATLPTSTVSGIAWHPAGMFICVQGATGDTTVQGWPWSPGFGVKLASSSSAGGSNPTQRTLCFRPQGDAIALGMAASPFVAAWPFTGTFGTKVANPSSLPGNTVACLAWAPGGGALAWVVNWATQVFGPYVQLWSGGFTGTAFALGGNGLTTPVGFGLWALDDNVFVGYATSSSTPSWNGGEWNPLGVAGKTFTITGAGLTAAQNYNTAFGSMLSGGVAIFAAKTSGIIFKSMLGTVGAIGAFTQTAGSNKGGQVMNEGERLAVTGALNAQIFVSAVEITL